MSENIIRINEYFRKRLLKVYGHFLIGNFKNKYKNKNKVIHDCI